MRIERLFIPGPVGQLEALIEYEQEVASGYCALACHPHPLFGGTMHTKAVFRAAKAALAEGLPTLRFNFRGVGKSQGEHAGGEGEQEDVQAALSFLTSRYPRTPVLMMGFSFGSYVGLRVGASDERVKSLVGMGLPVKSYDFSFLNDCPKPKLIVIGAEDLFCPRVRVEEVVAGFAPPKQLNWIEGADHYFTGRLEGLQNVIETFVRKVIQTAQGGS